MKKVLIVDDAAFMRLSIKNLIEANGFEVIGEAENGLIAIDKYKELQPDIVTMDITMPEMDGIESLTNILQFDPKAKIVMVSALGQESFVRKALLSGAKGFVLKPFKDDHVIQTLSKVGSL